MQNTQQSDGLQRDYPNWESCRASDSASKVSDAPRGVECPRQADLHATRLGAVAANSRNRRRSTRRALEAIIRVYGSNLSGNPFYEDARTINVSVHGALLVLNAPVSKGQKLLLFNEAAQRQQVCQIVDVRVQESESLEVAVAFPTPHAEFWQVFRTNHRIRLRSKVNSTKELKTTDPLLTSPVRN